MKIILSLLILISLFSYLLASRFSCPRFNYICCLSDSCKCFPLGVKAKCGYIVKCKNPLEEPHIYTNEPNNHINCDLIFFT